jgi:hypothetical protein
MGSSVTVIVRAKDRAHTIRAALQSIRSGAAERRSNIYDIRHGHG